MVPSESPTRLAIVGASVRAAAQSALRAGFDVVGADLFADADFDGVAPITKIEDYPDGLADWLAKQSVDAWVYTGALENSPDLIDRMAMIAPLWGVSGGALRRCRDPLVVQGVLAGYAVRFAETRLAPSVPSGEPGWFAKTYRHSSGVGVASLVEPSDWRAAKERGDYLQRRIEGEPYSAVYSLGDDCGSVLGICRQTIGTPGNPWAFVGATGPTRLGVSGATMLARLHAALAGPLALRGIIGVDFIVAPDGEATVVEINPRYPASAEVLERSRERSVVGALAAAWRGEDFDKWIGSFDRPVAKRLLFADRDVRVDAGFTEWARRQGLADLPHAGEQIERGSPICTVFGQGKTIEKADQAAEAAASETRRRLYDGPVG